MNLIPGPVRRGFETSLGPLVERLVAWQVSPNALTTVGTTTLVAGAVAFGAGSVRLGAALLLLSGLFDMLDGRVARATGGTTKFGAFYDSMLDRIGESALFLGIGVYFLRGGIAPEWRTAAVVIAVVALAGSLLVSYARARAEGLDLECKVGIAQRAERILGLGAPTLFFGAGPDGLLLLTLVSLLAVVACVTVVQRIVHVYRISGSAPPPRTTQARRVAPRGLAPYTGKGRRGE